MSKEALYRLADHTAVEPLTDRWTAWPHTFSPVPYALHLRGFQKTVLESYLKSPAIHFKSSRNPKLLGGAFVDIPPERAEQVGRLYAAIDEQHADLLALARDLTDVQNFLAREAQGQSLESFYTRLPTSLRGCVELVYDYQNRALVRCIESILYESAYYKRDIQSFRLFRVEHDNSRPYYMSTPRLPEPADIDWKVPFDHPLSDGLFQLDTCPQPLGAIRDLLGLSQQDESCLLPLLTDGYSAPAAPWRGPGVRLRYFGHACILMEWDGVSILTDPFIAVRPEQGGLDRLSYPDLPARIDFVLITHAHHDHFVFEALLRLRHRIGTLVVPRSGGLLYGDTSLKLLARKLGFKQVVEMQELDRIAVPGGEIVAVPFLGEHCDLAHAKTAYVVRAGNEQVLFAADSSCLDREIYARIRQLLGAIDTVFIGLECIGAPLTWVYGSLLPKPPQHSHSNSRRSHASNSAAALALLEAVQARRVYVYAMGREPWLRYFMALEPTDDDTYMRETQQLLKAVQALRFVDAQLLFGKKDLYLSTEV